MDSRHARIHSRLQRHVQSPAPVPDHGFPILAVAVLGITATALLLVAYYIFITKCCFNWQHFDPLRRFSSPNPTRIDDPLTAYSPSWRSRGLDEVLIREIPTFRYAGGEESGAKMASECVVCLSEFREADMLRVLPRCGHGFHLDCIDIWLQSNTNCPLCRAKISGEIRVPIDRIVAPASSPQYSDPTHLGRDEASPAIEFAGDDRRTERIQSSEQKKISKHRKRNHHLSIDVREKVEEEEEEEDGFSITAIRRSFSMDSAADRNVYLSVQEILRQSRHVGEIRNGGGSSSRVRRSFFSFGHGRGSKSSVLPIEL